MKTRQQNAIDLLTEHNEWRRGGEGEMIPPKKIGEAIDVAIDIMKASQWQPIDTAPKDGTEIIGYRQDCDMIMVRYTSLSEFLTDKESESGDYSEDEMDQDDWFYADFVHGGRLGPEEYPTHWMLPQPPTDAI